MDETNLASRIINEIVEPLKRMNIEAKAPPVLHDDGSTTGESNIGSDDSTIASSNISLSSPESVGSVSSGSMSPDELESVASPEPVNGEGFLLSDRNLETIVDTLKGLLSVPVVEQPPPIIEQPVPIVEQPIPIVEQPPPIVEQPVPVVEQPVPVVEQPVPIVEPPVPIVEQPVPVVEPPVPILAPNTITGNGFVLSDENLRKIVDTLKLLITSSNDLTQDLVTTSTKVPSETQEDTTFLAESGPSPATSIESSPEPSIESSPATSLESSPAPELAKTGELGSFLTTAITDAILQKPSRFKPLIPPFKLGLHLPGSTSEGYELGMPGLGTSSPSVESDSGRSVGLGLPGFGSRESSDKSSGKATVGSDSGRGLGLPGFDESGKSSVASDSGKATVGSESSPESESGDSGKPSLKSSSKLKKVVGVLKRLGKKPEPGLKLKNLLRTLKKFLSTGAESDSESESEEEESEFGTEESEFDSEEEESEDGSSKRGPPAEASEENEDKYEAPDPFTNIGKISMPELNTPKVKYINIDKDKFAKPAGVDLKDLINISIQPEVK
jgi:hypothetical protein